MPPVELLGVPELLDVFVEARLSVIVTEPVEVFELEGELVIEVVPVEVFELEGDAVKGVTVDDADAV